MYDLGARLALALTC